MQENTRYKAVHHGGLRTKTRVVVVHSTDGGTAEGAANWFASGKVKASAHVCVDDANVFRCVPDEFCAWAAHPFNGSDGGMHIEIAGFAKWTRGEWLAKDGRLRNSARVIAQWCVKYDIPAEWLTAEDIRSNARGCKGLVTHTNCVKGSGVGTHWDPGPGFPLDVLLNYVREEISVLTTPAREHLADLSGAPVTPLRAGEGEHSP